MAEDMPRSILFVCNQNTVRSPLAKLLADRRSRRVVFADSVGLYAGKSDSFAEAVAGELGGQLANHQSKRLEDVDLSLYDRIVALTEEASCRLEADGVHHDYWPVPDPTLCEGSREVILDAYRKICTMMDARLAQLLSPRDQC